MEIITSHTGLKAILSLNEDEIKWWRAKIQKVRKCHVIAPKDLIRDYIDSIKDKPNYFEQVKETSSFIKHIRDVTWETYIASELLFYKAVIEELLQENTDLRNILSTVITEDVIKDLKSSEDADDMLNRLSKIFGTFTATVFPYFFELSKSVTNSRRARAGIVFEEIIHSIMNAYSYPYNNQSQLGKKTFEEKGLGKIVDGILPEMAAYETNRSKCLVITMKTTLRERWQEVVEELNRTNIPSIHLLTLDDTIAANLLNTMSNHNITLVTYKEIKEKFGDSHTNIISFETLFNTEIPHIVEWWKRSYPNQY